MASGVQSFAPKVEWDQNKAVSRGADGSLWLWDLTGGLAGEARPGRLLGSHEEVIYKSDLLCVLQISDKN